MLGANGAMGYGSGALFTQAIPKVTLLARSNDKAKEGLAAAIKRCARRPSRTTPTSGPTSDLDAKRRQGRPRVRGAGRGLRAQEADLRARREGAPRRTRSSPPCPPACRSPAGRGAQRDVPPPLPRHPPLQPAERDRRHRGHPARGTDPALVDFVEAFSRERLGREIVRTADTPAFAGNRVGFKVLNEVAQLAEQHGPVLVGSLIGPYTGRAMPPLATVDLVGWDIHKAIVDNVHANTHDEAHATLALPELHGEADRAGPPRQQDAARGFFRRDGKTSARARSEDRRLPRRSPSSSCRSSTSSTRVAALHRVGRYREAMQVFLRGRGTEADLARTRDPRLHQLRVQSRRRGGRHDRRHRQDHGLRLQLGAAERAGRHDRARARRSSCSSRPKLPVPQASCATPRRAASRSASSSIRTLNIGRSSSPARASRGDEAWQRTPKSTSSAATRPTSPATGPRRTSTSRR